MLQLAFLDVGGPEVLFVFFLVLLLFGGERMPDLARGMGKAMREFKKATQGIEAEIKRALDEEPGKPSAAAKPKNGVTAPAPQLNAPSLPPSPPVPLDQQHTLPPDEKL